MPSPALQSLGIESLGPRYQAAVDQSTAADKMVETSLQEKNAALAPVEQKIRETNAAAPTPPKLENLDSLKFQHKGLTPQEMNDSVQTMLAFAAIGGAMTRQPMTAALNAFAKGVEGIVKGDQIVFNREKDEFDRHLKTAIAKNTQAIEEYKMAAEKHKGDLNGLMNEWRIIAAKHQDTVALAQFQSQNAKGAMQHIENLVKMNEAAIRADQHFSMQMKRMDEQFQTRGWQTFQKPDGTLVRVNAVTGEMQPIEGSAGLSKPGTSGKGGAGGAGGTGKGMTAIQATMYTDVATGYFRMGKLLEMGQQTGELPGGSPFLQTQMKNDGMVSAVRAYGINKALPEGFQQIDALLLGVAFDLASARSGGRGQLSDSKIREVTRQMPLSSDTEDTKELKYSLMKNQLEEANHTLPQPFQYDPQTRGPRGAQPAAPVAPAAPAGAELPSTNAKGWVLHTDANGNKAYVGPNKEIEEVQ